MGIANVRINSRRKGYWSSTPEVLDIGILPIDFLMSSSNCSMEEATPVIERIINVSAALVNLCPLIVPLD